MKPTTFVVRKLCATRAMPFLVVALLALPPGARAASPVDAYYYFVHWMSMSRTDLALEQFTDDAIVVAGPACVQSSPCIGKAAIQAGYLTALQRKQVPLPLQDQRFDGRWLRTRGETILQYVPGEAAVRLRGGYVFAFRDGLIASVHTELEDLSDRTTALIVEQRPLDTSASQPLSTRPSKRRNAHAATIGRRRRSGPRSKLGRYCPSPLRKSNRQAPSPVTPPAPALARHGPVRVLASTS